MKSIPQILSALAAIALWLSALLVPAYAQPVLTKIAFISNAGAYINDTIVEGATSPLAFTVTDGLSQPFLNASNSSLSLHYGTYYAISFRGYGSMVGPGTVSFFLNGTSYVQNVTFPDPTQPSGVFASFSLPGGDSVTVAATGLSADRISVIPDGGGLVPDGTPDAFYLFTFAPASVNPCDVNQDTFVNVADVRYIVREILNSSTPTHDLNHDGKVNALDAQIVVLGAMGLQCQVGPTVTLVNPPSGPQGQQNESVAVTGLLTHWVQGTTTASFGAGITVTALTINSATSATAVLKIDAAAAIGTRTVTFTTGAEVASTDNIFTVSSGPAITGVSPNTAQQGAQGLGGGGSVFLTGHDPDWHTLAGSNSLGAEHINQAAIRFVTDPAFNVFAAAGIHKFLWVTSRTAPAGIYLDTTAGLVASGFVEGTDFDRADASILPVALGQLGSTYNSIVVASDFGGILTQAELDVLDNNSTQIIDFLNSGGGLCAMAETPPAFGGLASTGFFGFLPFVVTSIPSAESESSNTVTAFGASLGLADFDVNGNFSHNSFASTGGLAIVDQDGAGEILSLAGRGKVTAGGVTGVVITATATNFVEGVTTASFGAGIAVTSLTVTSPTTAIAVLNIDPNAPVGARTVTMTTGAEVATLVNGFTVTAGTPLVTLVVPDHSQQGQQSQRVTVIGQSTHWVQGTTTASFGAGVTVTSLTINSATTATAIVNVDLGATVGPRLVTFTTGAEVVTTSGAFSVSGRPVLTAVNPNTGRQGLQNETVNLTGQYTHWAQGVSTASFGGGASSVQNFTVNGAADIWLAGQPDGLVLGGDTAPTSSPVLAWTGQNLITGSFLTISATGTTDYGGCAGASPDGGCGLFGFGPSLGISAFAGPADALIGVFLNAGNSSITLPDALDFTTLDKQSQATISPQLNQVFFIGDGLTGTGTGAAQKFMIPVGATQLYLASSDSAGANYNNTGAFNVVVSDSGTAATLTVNSPTSATATLSIQDSAPVGTRDVTVATANEVVTMANGFTVTPGPKLLSMSPAGALAGQANVPVTITGQNTHFTNASVIDLGAGMTLGSVSATDATHLSAQLTVAGSGNLVQNGSLEDLSGFFVNTAQKYMTLPAGSTTIAGWTVTPSTTDQIAWAQSPTDDSQYASNGKYFVNLSGVGANSPNGAISQQLRSLVSGRQYTFSMDTLVDTDQPLVTIGTATVALTAGQPFQIGFDRWIPQTGTFVADSSNPILTITNQDPGQSHVYVDNIVVVEPGAAVLGTRNLTVSTGTELEYLVNAFTVTVPPVLVSVTPTSGVQTQTNVPVTITGQYTHFDNTSVVTFSGTGVTAGAPTTATATSVTVPVTLTAGATLGSRQVQVQTGGETVSLAGAYTVLAPTPTLSATSPNSGIQGQQSESVSLTGQFTHWVQGTTSASFGAGVTVQSLTVLSATTATAVLNIAPAGALGARAVTVTTGTEVVSLAGGFTVSAGTPALTALSPNTGIQGQLNENVSLTGQFTHWVQGTSTVSFGGGITVQSFTILSATTATAVVNIDPAAIGPQTVIVTTGAETVSLNSGFTVNAGTPGLTLVNPHAGQQSQQNESVNLSGQFTHWAQGSTTVSFGAGITVAALAVNSPTTATATLNIDAAATTGPRNVTVTTGSEVVTLSSSFTVSAYTPVPTITTALPGSGLRGQAFSVAITGQNTHFQQGITKANFGAGVSVNGSIAGTPGLITVTSATTATASISVPATAAMGSRTIVVQTGSEEASLVNGFAVKGAPYLSSIAPNSAHPGDTIAVTIQGTYTSFQQGVTTATFGAGIAVGGAASGAAGPVAVSATGTATAQLTIDPAATPGLRSPIVKTGAEQASLTNSGFTVLGPVGGPAPVPTITSPTDGGQVSTLATVTGSVDSPNLANWVLEYQANGSTVFTQFGSGTSTTVGATFDPTMLPNGIAQIRLTATDVSGQTGAIMVSVVVAGKVKVGNFTLSFNDLTIPLAGIPIQIIRSYNTLNRSSGDFGFGWALDIQTTKVQTNRPLGEAWQGTKTGGILPTYCVVAGSSHVVSFALQDGTTYTFQPTFRQACNQLSGPTSVSMTFTPTGSTPPNASLAVPDGAGLAVVGDFPGDVYLADPDTFETYDPDQFILTLPTGVRLQISKSFGVQGLADKSGRTLTFSPNGIQSSSGPGVGFVRDGQNRITAIIDPNGKVLNYTYSATGDLTQVQDAMGHVSTFTYDGFHDLVSYVDASGHQPVRNVYDDSGRLIQVIDAFGNVTNLSHDLGASTETIADALGNQTTLVYDSNGNILSTTDPLGHITKSSFDASNNLASVTDPLGNTTTFTYDANNNRTTQTDALGHTTTLTYDQSNSPLTTTDPNGHTRTNSYDANGNILSTADTAGKGPAWAYDGSGNQTSMTDALGHTANYTYTNSGRLASSTDPAGVVTTYTYDGFGNRTSQSVAKSTPEGPQVLTTRYQYDANNNLILTTNPDGTTRQKNFNATGQITSETDELNRSTSYTYDDGGRLTQVTYPDGTSTGTVYDAKGRRTRVTARSGAVTTFVYDAAGRLTSMTDGTTGATTQTAYDAAGRKVSTTDPLGNTTQFTYDAANRTTSITDAMHHVTTFTYDPAGNKIASQDANGKTTTIEYDANNRPVKTVYPDGTFAQVTYDAAGHTASKTDAAGNTTQFAYDQRGHLLSLTDALGHATSYTYDDLGNRISQTDANGHTTKFSYDTLNRRTSRTLPGGESESFVYDSAGNLTSHTDFNGKVTAYSYDSQNRLLSKTPDPSFLAPAVTYTYLPTGQRASMTDATGTTTYTYDSSDRLSQVSKPNGTLSYSYDLADNLASLSTASGTSMTYTYDALNRLTSVSDAATGVTHYAFDPAGNLTGIADPNGVSSTYTYDSRNLLTNVAVAKGATSVVGYTYTLGATGRRLSVADLGGRAATYTYDTTFRLTSETVSGAASGPNGAVSYTYDPVGNRLQTTSTLAGVAAGSFTYDADDRLTTDTYDAAGNTRSSGGIADVYDFENHLIRHGAITMAYDGDGNRVSKTVGGVTTKYLVDEKNPSGIAQVIEESSSDGGTRKFVYGLQRISQKQFIAGSNTTLTSFYVYDGHGSVRALTDATGAVTDTYDYDAFGNLIHATGSTPNEFLFAGEQFDADLGLYYNRARYLKPSTGRFSTMDSFEGDPESPITLHKYLYANGDPVSLTDPSGHDADIGSFLCDFAIQTTLSSISSAVLKSPLGQSAQGWIASLLLGPTFFDFLETAKPDAWVGGFGASLTQGTGGKGGNGYKLGITFGAGQDFVIGRNGGLALFYYVGAGVTGGETASSQGLSVYLGALWSTPDSDAYAGSFFNVGVPMGSLPTKLVNAMKQGYSSMAQAAILSTEGSSMAYKAIIYGLVDLSYDVLNGSSATFFTGPNFDDPSRGFSCGVGFSNSKETSTSNLSITLSYFFQVGDTVSFK